MKVTVIDRDSMKENWGHGLFNIVTRTIEIPDTCDVCGGMRGAPTLKAVHEDGCTVYVDEWENPCGHTDKYSDLLRRHWSH